MKKYISILSLLIIVFAVGCNKKSNTPDVLEVTPDPVEDVTQIEMSDIEITDNTIAVLETSKGVIKIQFYPNEAPETVRNFVELTHQKKYVDVPIHRIIPNFMIQMGDFENGNGTGGHSYEGPGSTVVDEPHSKRGHVYGAVSMAKTAAPNSGGSQFFIVQNKNGTPHLDGIHTVFGYVIEGMDVVEAITDVDTSGPDVPVEDIVFTVTQIIENEGK